MGGETTRGDIDVLRTGLSRDVFDSLTAGVVVQGSGGEIVAANDAACRMLGLAWDQVMGLSSTDPRWRAVHEDGSDFPGDAHPAMVAIATGRSVRDVVMGVHKPDGSLTWILINSEPIRTTDGAATGSVVTTFTDISEPTRLRALLLESEQRYRLLAENSADIVVRTEDDVIVWVSPSLTQALGWVPDDWIGKGSGAFVHPDDLPEAIASARALAPGVPERVRRRVRAQDGNYHWVDVQVRLDPVALGGSRGAVVALRVVDGEVVAREVEHRAAHDPLTGLLNRAETLDRLARTLGDAATQGHVTGVVFCDVDDFKVVNDSHGHIAGDAVLREVGSRLRERLRQGDAVGRVGGDEILVVLENIGSLARATTLAEALIHGVARRVDVGGVSIAVTMSAGVTVAAVADSVDDIVARADQAMYVAKHGGKNRVVAVEP